MTPETARPRVTLIAGTGPFEARLGAALDAVGAVVVPRDETSLGRDPVGEPARIDSLVFAPAFESAPPGRSWDERVRTVLDAVARGTCRHLVVVSSAEVHEPHHRHPGLVDEGRIAPRGTDNPIAHGWRQLESDATNACARGEVPLAVLRPAALASTEGTAPWARRLGRRVAAVVVGHDPTLQLLHPDDLIQGIVAAVTRRVHGCWHLVPRAGAPVRRALRAAGLVPLPLPWWCRAATDAVARRRPTSSPRAAPAAARGAYLRYSWTVSSRDAHEALGYTPRFTTIEAAARLRRPRRQEPRSSVGRLDRAPAETAPSETTSGVRHGLAPFVRAPLEHDAFGCDRVYIDRFRRTLFRFLHDVYWRVDARGLRHVPRQGAMVLCGTHRGLMPFDGVMALHLLATRLGRYPRFLIHPTLIKFPFLANFMIRLGGVVACAENAARVLDADRMLGVFPEGIRGAFCRYRDAYRLQPFGRDHYVRFALRAGAPIVPMVTVGSAETFPILGRLDWRWWKRVSEWPFLPITPTFPLLPVPLPSKWHTRFLPPIETASYGPEAADDARTVRAIGTKVRERMEATLTDMRNRRRSIFYGALRPPTTPPTRPDPEAS